MNYPQPSISNMSRVSGLNINKLLLQRTGTYNQQYLRPFETQVDGTTLQELNEVLARGNKITPNTIAGISNQIMRPTAIPECTVNIANGWDTPRFRFMLEIEYERGGIFNTELILGYTEHGDVSFNNNIDPTMKFIVNSITTARTSRIMTPSGSSNVKVVADTSHVVSNPLNQNFIAGKPKFKLRPQDVLSVMSVNNELPEDVLNNHINFNAVTRDEPILSKRKNGVASYYASSILDGYRVATSTGYGTESEILTEATGYVRDNMLSHVMFLQRLKSLEGSYTAAFTYNDLMNISPDVQYVTTVVEMNHQQLSMLQNAGSTASWGTSTIETQVASIIASSLSALITEFGLIQISIASTNDNLDGQPTTHVLHANAFSTVDLSRPCEIIVAKFNNETVRDITYNNSISYSLNVNMDLLGETTISLSLNGQAPVDYVLPSFADSLIAPIVTFDRHRPNNMASSFSRIMDNLEFNNDNRYIPSSIDSNTFSGDSVNVTPYNDNYFTL